MKTYHVTISGRPLCNAIAPPSRCLPYKQARTEPLYKLCGKCMHVGTFNVSTETKATELLDDPDADTRL